MTRKYFQALAEAIRQTVIDTAQRKALAEALLPALRASNAQFNTQKFLDAVTG